MAAKGNEQHTNLKIYNLDETSDNIEEISHEIKQHVSQNVADRVVTRFKTFHDDLETSFSQERSGIEEYYENEKSDIIKGFMLEKKMLNEEHDKEKRNLIQSFIKERQKLLQSFQKQVKDVKVKMRKSSQESESIFTSVGSEARPRDESQPSKLLIRVGGNRIVTPEEFLATLEIEDRVEKEKETIEKMFRKEKDRIKEKLEIDYERKLLREKQKHDNELRSLKSEVENLKGLKFEVASVWKQQASKIETGFQKERSELERYYKEEGENLRKILEEEHRRKLDSQQREYDQNISKLKSELLHIKKDATKHKDMGCDNSQQLRHDMTKQLQESFERETKIIRKQNEKLSGEINSLTTEKYELSRKIREMEVKIENDTKVTKQNFDKMKKEYDSKIKKIRSQNDKLNLQLRRCDKQKEELFSKVQSNKNNNKIVESRLAMTERTVTECEDIIINTRLENSNLSHEINLLRHEKDELLKCITSCQEKERTTKCEVNKLEKEATESSGRYALLEREKLQHEKLIASLRRELESSLLLFKEIKTKGSALENEVNRLRQLLDCERREGKRLHERFKQDAELLRKKETENASMSEQLDKLKTELQNVKNKMELDNEKILRTLNEKQQLIEQLEKLKLSESIQKKHEIVTIQSQYVKEFSKRLDYVKANYKREIRHLKNKINSLKQNNSPKMSVDTSKTHSLETTNQWKEMNRISDCNTVLNLPNVNGELSFHVDVCSFLNNEQHNQNGCNLKQSPCESSEMMETSSPEFTDQIGLFKKYSHKSTNGLSSPKTRKSKPPVHFSSSNTDCHKRNHIESNTVCKAENHFFLVKPESSSQNVLNHNEDVSAFKSFQQLSNYRTSNRFTNGKQNNNLYEKEPVLSKPSGVYPWSNHKVYDNASNGSLPHEQVDSLGISSVQTLPAIPEVTRSSTTQTDEDNIDEKTPTPTPRYSSLMISPVCRNLTNGGKDICSEEERKGEKHDGFHEAEVNEIQDTVRRLCLENSELQKRISKQQQEILNQETSCEELQKRRMMLEKLVDRLQTKLREETSRRRQLEQENNAINEEKEEENMDNSTV
ncbi:repetitive organellar protein-like isoform X2 [Hydractinia symbiolongicarpus]|uniref:repetitive organellar protein-like isoform X2 n=1 Tax=Hydractinia symbiolongicarpus TaxID=13093 RepID=UPI00254EA2D5|nr:repetitive organellar protein-like isoform X2 [Hydractinia symbiolongicarpus]